MSRSRRLPSLLAAALLLFGAALANAQAYTSIVIFGDSLSDTGNDATLSAARYTVNAQVPGPATGYTNGRFTDGTDTSPAARSYNGVWVEQLAAKLAATPTVKASLLGGTDYAYGYATTTTGTAAFTYGPGNALSFPIENMQQQLADYLATKPTITNKTLFVVWGGANDLLQATATNATQVVTQGITDVSTVIQTLVAAGATDFLVVNLPPLGLVPLNNGSATTSVPANQLSAAWDAGLAGALSQLTAAYAGKVRIYPLDVYTLFNTLVGPPVYKGFANVTSSSQGNTAINPDTYLFWDSLHPTTYGHSLIAAAALTAIGTPIVTSSAVTSSNLNVNLGTSVTLTASVTSTTGTPTGTVTFFDGTTVLGTSLVYGSTTTATGTFTTTTLAAGTHNLTASFAGVNGYNASTSPAVVETVTAPAFSASLNTSSTIIPSGHNSTALLLLNPVGGFTGTVTFACGTLPAHFTCSVSPTSVTYPSSVTTANINIGTSTGTALLTPPVLGGHFGPGMLAACLCFPGLGFFGLLSQRRRLSATCRNGLLTLAALISLGTVAGLTGCSSSGSNANFVPDGNYTIPIVYTVNGTATTVNLGVTIYN